MVIRCKFCNNPSVHGCKTCGIAICEKCSNELECPNCNPAVENQCVFCLSHAYSRCSSCQDFVCPACVGYRENETIICQECHKDLSNYSGLCYTCGGQAFEICQECQAPMCEKCLEISSVSPLCKDCYSKAIQTIEEY